METVSLTLPEDHPLIQLGFRGTLRLDDGLEVRVTSGGGTPSRRRHLPSLKRRALVLIAAGGSPSDLADRLELCLERAEALHEELTSRLGIDQIARQVRSVLRSEPVGSSKAPPEDSSKVRTDENESRESYGEGGRSMADRELVRTLFPDALARCPDGVNWLILPDPEDGHTLGRGPSELEAWSSAAVRLCEDEWFRPILTRLVALKSDRRADV